MRWHVRFVPEADIVGPKPLHSQQLEGDVGALAGEGAVKFSVVLIGQSDIKCGVVLPHEAEDCSRRETERRTRLPVHQGFKTKDEARGDRWPLSDPWRKAAIGVVVISITASDYRRRRRPLRYKAKTE
jgi:hypothetical protein